MAEVYVLDTNAVIALQNGEANLVALLHKTISEGNEFRYSMITKAEMAAGLHHYTDKAPVLGFLNSAKFASVTDQIALEAGLLRSAQIVEGRKQIKIPDAIILITAKLNGWTLVSNDAHMQLLTTIGGKLRTF